MGRKDHRVPREPQVSLESSVSWERREVREIPVSRARGDSPATLDRRELWEVLVREVREDSKVREAVLGSRVMLVIPEHKVRPAEQEQLERQASPVRMASPETPDSKDRLVYAGRPAVRVPEVQTGRLADQARPVLVACPVLLDCSDLTVRLVNLAELDHGVSQVSKVLREPVDDQVTERISFLHRIGYVPHF